MMAYMTPLARPRFKRQANPRHFELTDRDIALLQLVAVHRIARSTHLRAFLDAPRQPIQRRLYFLYQHGYLDRPPAQIHYFKERDGSRPIAYALSDKGHACLTRRNLIRDSRTDWSAKNRDLGREHLDHTLEITEFMANLTAACRARSELRLLDRHQLLAQAPEETRAEARPFLWHVSVEWEGMPVQLGIEPDQAFALDPGSRQANFFLEADRGTMPVARASLTTSSLLRKLLAYTATHNAGLHRSRFGLLNFRVLFVVPSRDRVDTLIEAYQAHRGVLAPANVFLFADPGQFVAADVLTAVWRNGRGESVRLIP